MKVATTKKINPSIANITVNLTKCLYLNDKTNNTMPTINRTIDNMADIAFSSPNGVNTSIFYLNHAALPSL